MSMRFALLTVGKLRDKPARALAERYAERIDRYGSLRVTEVKESRASDPATVQREESEALLAAAPDRAVLIALDERGDALDSIAFARTLEHDMLHGRNTWALLIGGAHGHAASLRERADRVWALSALTFPHDLARVVLLEQVYRACTILRGEPYHKV